MSSLVININRYLYAEFSEVGFPCESSSSMFIDKYRQNAL